VSGQKALTEKGGGGNFTLRWWALKEKKNKKLSLDKVQMKC
jgi:hypothetical protein